ncbi:POTRA domain-containing protein [Providencia vermicola]|uniref:POTRA domain-containing protein n=1 Tax=Providencia vermicola TaxID=333965 RepID=UPI003D26DB71
MMKTLIRVAFFLLLIALTELSYSESLLLTTNRNSIQFEQKKHLNSETQQREALENQYTVTVGPTLKSANGDARCFTVSQIELVGISVFTSTMKKRWILPYQDQCLSLDTVQHLTKQITNDYIEKGYITSQASIYVFK